jgi:hypothetical protein
VTEATNSPTKTTARQGRPAPASPAPVPRRRLWADVAIILLLSACAGLASFKGSQALDPIVLDWKSGDSWFQSDTARIRDNMTDRHGNHYRASVHPLFSLVSYSGVRALRETGLDELSAVRAFTAGTAAVWIAAIFLLLRVIGCRRTDATIFSVLAALSAAAVFWFVVPETYPLGSISILIALGTVAIAERMRLHWIFFVASSALSFSFTITNGMAGIAAAIARFPVRRAVAITGGAIAVVLALWCVQKVLFPRAGSPFSHAEEMEYVLHEKSGGPLAVARSFLFHSVLMPEFREIENPARPDWPLMATQGAAPGSGSQWGAIGIVLWALLLVAGVWGAVRAGTSLRFRIALALVLAGQLALHLLYGEETFLYSCHFAPLLVIVAAFGTFTRARPAVLAVAAVLAACAALSNGIQLTRAAEFLESHGSPRRRVLYEMDRRPGDPWPRGEGHVVIAVPGTPETEKAYHEPGGGFSPTPGTFGISLWVAGDDGAVLLTSDSLPLSEIRQHFVWQDAGGPPAVRTETAHYTAHWANAGPGRWRLDLRLPPAAGKRRFVVLRSVGPAGGSVEDIAWDGERLLVNGGWKIRLDPPPREVSLGDERIPGWTLARTGLSRWTNPDGWGHARCELGGEEGGEWTVLLESPRQSPAEEPLKVEAVRSALEMDLPDPDFVACLEAQVAHLLMSIVGRETRSSDPINVPVPWQRTGAYIITALASAGRLDAARELSRTIGENDFYGGFGAEGDAPGLGIWALEGMALRLRDEEYDRWALPHVRRKAEWISKMLETPETIHARVENPIVPHHAGHRDIELVAEPPGNDLIMGRMDFHRPAFYMNAVSHRGLLDAGSLSERLGEREAAGKWRSEAERLKAAWEKAFRADDPRPNDRTFVTGLWPTWIAASTKEVFEQGLRARWDRLHDAAGGFRETPLWTYFELADAHQWLVLGKPDRTWTTLRWFWANQASPGLFTWWEDRTEGNAYGGWERIRGWVKPPNSQPHYWTAAEMLLLQLDMLAMADLSSPAPELVVGAGVPAAWLPRAMSVRGISTRAGRVDWTWDGQKMRVTIAGPRCAVRLGPAFPAGTSLSVTHVRP